ncbi:DUF1194 domain-containing protein [Roseomonas genomospecies 6]|uniref:DUF1194 domain-containing protein n=1 Tax=Roseomonas genomospecies 6 TaxID=214106 RepID=A0A9W7NKG6_9PROT|nr:DUF1194 domain-containing protein [Roseomonas genomospecies 6]KAA0681385.1 DUF1194 domain-containing protein [Roseomonas genomospecies 6]
MDGAWRLAGVAVAVLLAGGADEAAKADTPVDLELVLAVDVSGSVDAEEGRLQREGYVAALTDPKVQAAIRGGPYGRIAVTYVEWAGDGFQRVTVPWTLLSDRNSVESFASSIAESPYLTAQWTSISAAIDFSARLFNDNGFEGVRRVIDVSGDGVNNRGRPVQWARDEAVAAGITINGLPILNDRPNPWGGAAPTNLDGYYQDHVIGGPGAFLVPAVSFEAFADAILSKLLLEISGLPPDPGTGAPTGLASR